MPPLVSVIVPTYNRPARLRECLRAIARQTFSDFEVIVVNDGGVPIEADIEGIREQPVRVLNQPARRGHVAARNRAVEIARGQYIALCDDDDLWLPEHLGAVVACADAGADLAYTDCEIVVFEERARGRVPRERELFAFDYALELLRHWNFIPPSTALYRGELHAALGEFDPAMDDYWDWDWWLRIAAGHRVRRVPVASVLIGVDAEGENASAIPERMAENLARLCAKHGLGELPTSNFRLMLREPSLQPWRRPSRIVWDGTLGK